MNVMTPATAFRAMTQDERTVALAVHAVCGLNKLVARLATAASQQCASLTDVDAIALCEMALMKRRFLAPETVLIARNMETRLRGGRAR